MKGTGIEEIGLVISIASLHFTIDTTEYEPTSHEGILLCSVMRQRRDLCWKKSDDETYTSDTTDRWSLPRSRVSEIETTRVSEWERSCPAQYLLCAGVWAWLSLIRSFTCFCFRVERRFALICLIFAVSMIGKRSSLSKSPGGKTIESDKKSLIPLSRSRRSIAW